MIADISVRCAQLHPSGGAVRHEESIEGISRPRERKPVTNQSYKWGLVNDEPLILCDGICEFWILHLDAADLGQKLDLEKRDRRHSPRAISI
jgi:hypothetical protein